MMSAGSCAMLTSSALMSRSMIRRAWSTLDVLVYSPVITRRHCRTLSTSASQYVSPATKPSVVVAMSGGVDSSVAALLMHQLGYRVTGLHMVNWDERDETGQCNSDREAADVRAVCRQIGIAYEQTSFVREYWNDVFVPMIQEYQRQRTPNPDTLCNRHIKFDAALNYVAQRLGSERMATGHYARTYVTSSSDPSADLHSFTNNYQQRMTEIDYIMSQQYDAKSRFALVTSTDSIKDQTYFLSLVKPDALLHSLFPIGHLRKSQVREIARSHGLVTATKPDSMGICFIGRRKFASFLTEYIDMTRADIITITGEQLGHCDDMERYCIGQRFIQSGQTKKWYVCRKDLQERRLIVCDDRLHPALLYDEVYVRHADMNWINGTPPIELTAASNASMQCYVRLRSTEALRRCTITGVRSTSDSEVNITEYRIRFIDGPHNTVSPGQTVVIYYPIVSMEHSSRATDMPRVLKLGLDGVDFVCLGGGALHRPGPSYYEMAKTYDNTKSPLTSQDISMPTSEEQHMFI